MGDFWSGAAFGLVVGLSFAVAVAAHLTAWMMENDHG